MRQVEIYNLAKFYPNPYGEPFRAVVDFNLNIEKGEFIGLIGHSGCGKSTVLTMLAGLNEISDGGVIVGDHEIEGAGPDRAVVFQSPCLMPWMTAYGNVMLGVKNVYPHATKAEQKQIVEYALCSVGLADAMDKRPRELSGGMQQRVGIARALTSDPAILLMDEPLGALDALTRERAQELILKVWRDTGKMVFFITHSVEEALFMGTKLIVMSPRPGRISHVFDLPFSQRYFETGNARSIKASAEFIGLREEILQIIFADEAGAQHE